MCKMCKTKTILTVFLVILSLIVGVTFGYHHITTEHLKSEIEHLKSRMIEEFNIFKKMNQEKDARINTLKLDISNLKRENSALRSMVSSLRNLR